MQIVQADDDLLVIPVAIARTVVACQPDRATRVAQVVEENDVRVRKRRVARAIATQVLHLAILSKQKGDRIKVVVLFLLREQRLQQSPALRRNVPSQPDRDAREVELVLAQADALALLQTHCHIEFLFQSEVVRMSGFRARG
jgi:hypothetical protein